MLKLRNAVLTALLAFCLAMPFVSCSFNDGATGDVSGDVKVQSDNNQNGGNENPSGGDNGGNGGSTGGNEKPSGGDEDSGDNGNENPSGGNNGGSGNENPSGGDNGGSGHEHPSGGDSGTDEPGTDEPGTDESGSGDETMYTVMYNGAKFTAIPKSVLSVYAATYGLVEGSDYTIDGAVITLTESGYNKVTSEMPGEGDEPVPDVPVPDVPGDVEGTMYTVMYNGSPVTYPDGEPITFIGDQDDISYEAESLGLDASDYTIEGTYIILNEAGNAKVQQMLDSHGNI